MFIREISTGVPEAAARTILSQNILGGMCARVCPTETLCEEACVREAAEGRPVEIGRLQRYATDTLMAEGGHPFARAAPTGRRVAVVGAGPAGLACAHRLAMLGHDVALMDGRAKPGGLNEFGIAAYKAVDGFAQAEVAWLLGIGGITLRPGAAPGPRRDDGRTPRRLRRGLPRHRPRRRARARRRPTAARRCARRSTSSPSCARRRISATLPVGRRVVVIGGGMTAIDAGVQAKKLGAEEVTIAYRRGRDRMAASLYEQELAATAGVRILSNAAPVAATATRHGLRLQRRRTARRARSASSWRPTRC